MIVCIEGPDGAGKSTLVNYLVEKGMTKIHSNSETKNDLDYHLSLLDEDGVVLDRANLGEIVYPAIYNREPKMSWDDQIDFMNACMDRKVLYIIFYASNFETLKERLFKRGDTEQVLENAEKINLAFRILAEEFSALYDNVFALDISKVDDQIQFCEDSLQKYLEILTKEQVNYGR